MINLPQSLIKDIIIHSIYSKDGEVIICYEIRGEWTPSNCLLSEFFAIMLNRC